MERKKGAVKNNFAWLTDHLEAMKECPLCLGRHWRLLYQLPKLSVYQCTDCRMMFLHPYLPPDHMKKIFSSPEFLKKISSFFSNYFAEKAWNTPRTLGVYRRVLKAAKNHAPRLGKLVDVGCGQGAFLRVAQAEGWQAFGIEPNCPNAKELGQKYGIPIYQSDFFEASLDHEAFDVVSLWDLIEHVPNPHDMIRRCHQIMRKGGVLIVATPNHLSFLDGLASWVYRLSGGKFTYPLENLYTVDHTLYFTDGTLKSLLEKEGLEILASIKVNTDLSRYFMKPLSRILAEVLLAVSQVLYLQNRVILIARKK